MRYAAGIDVGGTRFAMHDFESNTEVVEQFWGIKQVAWLQHRWFLKISFN